MSGGITPGEVLPGDGTVELFVGASLVELTVANTGDRAVQVGSHYHFAEANPALDFDRAAARGHRLAIPAGTSVRFEPGIERRVELVPLGGRRVVAGLRGEVTGPLDAAPLDVDPDAGTDPPPDPHPGAAPVDADPATDPDASTEPHAGAAPVDVDPDASTEPHPGAEPLDTNADPSPEPPDLPRGSGRSRDRPRAVNVIGRPRYARLYGPTTGDRIRLADTDLLIEVEADLAGGGSGPDGPDGPTYGDEAVFGGGKVIRESMGQATATRAEGTPDLVITGAVILDHWGIVKADIGVRDGRIVAIGKAGNPDTMDGVDPALVIGPSTEILAGNGKILTAGAVDSHVHLIAPQQLEEALAAGITTIIGGGTGPAEGTKATTVTPGAWNLGMMLRSLDGWPVNVALLGKGNTVSPDGLREQLAAGASGFKLHEDWGTTPAAIDACLRVCDESGVQAAIHTDTLNEAGYVQSTLAAIAGRTIHTYHTEGAGGGHAPDIVTVVREPYVLPSSTNPTRPHTVNTVDEHLDMLMVCHHLNPTIPEDLAFAESRIRPSTIAAEDVLHDLGAISMIGSDSQAMGRIGEVILRTWQTAHVMKRRRGALPGDGAADNMRAKRYVAKTSICPAVAHGLAEHVGSVEVGKLADLVLWDPAFFGVRPHVVVKGGFIAWAQMGDANASIPTPQPVLPRPMFGASPPVAAATSLTFVAPAVLDGDGLAGTGTAGAGRGPGLVERLGLRSEVVPVADTRRLGKADMPNNDVCPDVRVDPDTFAVTIDGDLVEADPAVELPMAQRYFLF